MKCMYYLTSTLDSTGHIAEDLHEAGISDWFIHILSKDEGGLKKEELHSSNYFEQLNLLRYGIIGAITGFLAGLLVVWIGSLLKLLAPDTPVIVYYAIIGVMTLFGAWEGGFIGIRSENKKIAVFHEEIEAGNYLILIYARAELENIIKTVMSTKHPGVKLVAIDEYFYNPLTKLKRI
jgi:xanthosine utilization system XapX-like protein